MTIWKPELLPPRSFGWGMKRPESARTAFGKLADGRLEMSIEHDVVRGVTPEMLRWWFLNIDDVMEYGGETYPRYLVWHPLDHVRFEVARLAPDGTAGRGARFRIVEAFGRDPDRAIDSVEEVEKLDEAGLTLSRYVLGDLVFRLEHRFAAVEGGTRYRSRMLVGSRSRFGRLFFNRLARPFVFPDEMGPAWIRHNVEEVGNFERFLPGLYRAEHAPRDRGRTA